MDVIPKFPEIGRIRKGAIKPDGNKGPGRDLTYFRFEIDEGEKEAAEFIAKLYPGEPRAISIWLPFQTVNENFMYCREAYVAGGLLHRCSLWENWENHRIDFQRDEKGNIVIQDGNRMKACNGEPVGSWTNRETGEVNDVFCKPVGRLKVIIPELQRMVFLTALTSSIHDIENLRSELHAYERMGPKGLAGIPLILKRSPKKISAPKKGGGRVRREMWMLSLEVNPMWAQKVFQALTAASLPEVPALEAPKDAFEAEWQAEESKAEEFSKSKIDDDFGVENKAEVPMPKKLDETVYYTFAKKKGIFAEAQAIMNENEGDVKASWIALLKGHVPPAEWPKG